MSDAAPRPAPPSDAETARALSQQAREPLLPAEKQLIAGSLALGVLLLGLLWWVTATWFPVR